MGWPSYYTPGFATIAYNFHLQEGWGEGHYTSVGQVHWFYYINWVKPGVKLI
jgi:hypothetical protein